MNIKIAHAVVLGESKLVARSLHKVYMSGFQPWMLVGLLTWAFSTPASKLAGDPGFGPGWYMSRLWRFVGNCTHA